VTSTQRPRCPRFYVADASSTQHEYLSRGDAGLSGRHLADLLVANSGFTGALDAARSRWLDAGGEQARMV
jgi:hypothetical protein